MRRPRYMFCQQSLSIGLFLGLICAPWAAAEEFVLHSGARIHGQWVNRGDRPLKVYVIDTEPGGRLTLARGQVAKTIHHRPAKVEYERIAPTYPDTVDAQWSLAEWCREHRLRKRRREHLRRVVELDPGHVRARYALGYSQLHGRWVRQDEALTDQGYVFFQGKWRLPQEVDLLKEGRRVNEAERRWLMDTSRWRTQLSSDVGREALENFLAVRDPHAIPAMARLLRQDRDRRVRLLYVEVLGGIEHQTSTSLLVGTALNDHDEEIYHACIDQLVHRNTPPLVKRFAETLRDANNRRVNRAGYALGRLQDEMAIEPLIEALVTTHLVALPDPSGNAPGATTAGMIRRNDTDLGSYFAVRNGPQTVEVHKPNKGVLAGLEKLAGLSFGYDQRAWRDWYLRNRRPQPSPTLSRTALP